MENIRKEAELWQECIRLFRKAAEDGGKHLETSADEVIGDLDAICDLFVPSKLEETPCVHEPHIVLALDGGRPEPGHGGGVDGRCGDG